MRVYAPAAFRWSDGKDYPFGWQEIQDDSTARAMKAASKVFDDEGSAAAAVVQASVSGAGNQIMTAGVSGSATDWQASATGKEGWLFQPSGLTGTASFSLDASNDGVTVAETLWSVALYVADNNKNCFPFPLGIGIGYAKYRWRCTNDGGGTHNIARGF